MKVIKFLLFFVGLFSFQLRSEVSILNKNTFTILAPKYKHCSPLEGAIGWESNMIENMYLIGDPTHATTRLVKELFYLHNDGSFDITRAPNRPNFVDGNGKSAAYFTPAITAELICCLERCSTKQEIEDFKSQISNQYIKKFIERYNHVFPSGSNCINNLKKIMRLMCDSYLECSPDNPEALYLPFTTHKILLSHMWKKITTDQDLVDYFKSFARTQYPIEIISQEVIDRLEELLAEKYTRDELLDCFKKISTKDIPNLVSDHEYESTICSLLINAPLEMISHASGVKYRDQEFPDCGEVSLLNFFNQITFNKTTGRFDLSLLESQGITVHPRLKKFYEEYKFPYQMKTKQVHNDWAVVVSEIPEVIYGQGGTQQMLELGKSDPTNYCNIAGNGYTQIVKVLKFLLGIESYTDIAKLSHDNFNISCSLKEEEAKQYNTLVITVNNEPYLEWHCTVSHFSLKYFQPKNQNQRLPKETLQKLLQFPIERSPRACSLMTLSQSTDLFERIATDQTSQMNVLNFACLLPQIKNADESKEFLQQLLDRYAKSSIHFKPAVIDYIKRIYGKLPDDAIYIYFLADLIIKNRTEDMYAFIFDEIRKPVADPYAVGRKEEMKLLIMKKMIQTNDSSFYNRTEEIFDSLRSSLYKTEFIEYIILDEKNELANIDKIPRDDFARRKFLSCTIHEQKTVCECLIRKKITRWFELIVNHLKPFDWTNYKPNEYESQSFKHEYIMPQPAFNALLKSDSIEIKEWLMTQFNHMNDVNKQQALKVFSIMPTWNEWIQENFGALRIANFRFVNTSLYETALKILIEQNDPTMATFICTEIGKLDKFILLNIFEFILKHKKSDFYKLIPLHFKELSDQNKEWICECIILYNHLNLYSIVENFLSETENYQRASLLKTIVSDKYLFQDNSIRTNQQEDSDEMCTLIEHQQENKWYPLVAKWLMQTIEFNGRSVIANILTNIDKKKIQELFEVAEHAKNMLKSFDKVEQLIFRVRIKTYLFKILSFSSPKIA